MKDALTVGGSIGIGFAAARKMQGQNCTITRKNLDMVNIFFPYGMTVILDTGGRWWCYTLAKIKV